MDVDGLFQELGASGTIIHPVDGRMVCDTYEHGRMVGRAAFGTDVSTDEHGRPFAAVRITPEEAPK